METDEREVLTAFVDGEAVEPGELARALAEPGGREALLDFMLLRAALVDEAEPPPAFVGQMRSRLVGSPRSHRIRRSLRMVAAAAVVVLAGFGAIDLAGMLRSKALDGPPEPTRVIRFEPGVDWGPVGGR